MVIQMQGLMTPMSKQIINKVGDVLSRVAIRLDLGRTVWNLNVLSGVRRSLKPDAYFSS